MTASTVTSPQLETDTSTRVSKPKKVARIAAWVTLTLFLLILFTLFKLPEERLQAWVDSNISMALSQKGISYMAGETHIGYFMGLSYTLKDVTIHFPPPTPPGHLDRLEVSPSLLPLIFKKISASFGVYDRNGSLTGSFSVKGTQASLAVSSKKLDLARLSFLSSLAGIGGSAVLDGDVSFTGDTAVPQTWDGKTDLTASKVVIDSQLIQGFMIPQINISDVKLDTTFQKGKLLIKTFRFGKLGNTSDDIQGTISGDIILGKLLDSSILNVKVQFSVSENIKKAFALLDTILGAGKQADGSYAYQIIGPLSTPNPIPISSAP